MPRYVIHVGPHKTGSTYLQLLFRRLSPELMVRGILYPSQWVAEGSWGHSLLPGLLRAGRNPVLAQHFAELNKLTFDTVLISAEDLSLLPIHALELLKSYLQGCHIDIVFHCRRWLHLLPSSWREVVKHGRRLTLPEFMLAQFIEPFASNTLNYAIRLDAFERVFGKESLSLVSYNNIVDQGGDLGEHFFRTFLLWENAPLIPGIRPNESLGILDIEVIRVLNCLEQTQSAQRSGRYLQMKTQFDLSAAFAAMQRHRQTVRLNENAPMLRLLHDQIFEKYGNCMVPPESGMQFFCPIQGEIEYVKESYLLEAGVTQALSAVAQKLRD